MIAQIIPFPKNSAVQRVPQLDDDEGIRAFVQRSAIERFGRPLPESLLAVFAEELKAAPPKAG